MENLFGVNIQKEAVRVACFSLYLAMCDEIEPRYVWDRVKFPLLRKSRLVVADFFHEDVAGFRSFHERQKYDIVVGNAPWGTGSVTKSKHARKWATDYRWDVSNEDIGPLFLAKGAKLTKPDGRISMLQSSGLLFKTSGKAASFRKQLFKKHQVEQVVNLSALRFGLFANAVGPACVFCLQPNLPDGSPITYVSPKPSRTTDDEFRIVFDSYDFHTVCPDDAEEDPRLWTALMWGGPRDYSLLQRLSGFSTLEALEAKRLIKTRRGIVRGDRRKRQDTIVDRPLLDTDDFPTTGFPYLDGAHLPKNVDALINDSDSINWEAFDTPQIILKLAYLRATNRFQARIVRSPVAHGIICSQSYISVHFEPGARAMMEGACLIYNSRLATYYMLLTSSRFASFRQAVQMDELLRIPLPDEPVSLIGVATPAEADQRLREALRLKPAEWALVDDAFDYTMQAFTADVPGVADDGMLRQYGEAFTRVLRAGFGKDKRIRVTLYRTPRESPAPVRLVGIHLDWPGDDQGVQFHDVQLRELLDRLVEISHAVEEHSAENRTVRRRVFQVYDTIAHGGVRVSTVYLCKPNLAQYWTRSMAMRDADVVSADLVRLAAAKRSSRRATSA